jgi:hypothetical protein
MVARFRLSLISRGDHPTSGPPDQRNPSTDALDDEQFGGRRADAARAIPHFVMAGLVVHTGEIADTCSET